MTSDRTPVIIGVGQVVDRLGAPEYQRWSPTEIAARAARKACDDALSTALLAPLVDAVVSVRTTADSLPAVRDLIEPFGAPDNVPAAVARWIGAKPGLCVYSQACGDEPQKLLGEFAERIAAGELDMVLLCGGEATSTVRAAVADGTRLDWNELVGGPIEDRGSGLDAIMAHQITDHGLVGAPPVYALLEHARRGRLGLSRDAYAGRMGALFEGFSRTAATNPLAAVTRSYTAQELVTPGVGNRVIADPYSRLLVARDQVNLGAAVLLTSVGNARSLGIAADKWVFLHGHAHAVEQPVIERPDLGDSPAMRLVYDAALAAAGKAVADIAYFDLYSCFPVAVFTAIDALGLEQDDPRGFTLTGGLPYFGGPGNNYSMHGIAAMAEKLRADPGAFGVVGANGGYLSTHAVGVYSTTSTPVPIDSSGNLQARIAALPKVEFDDHPSGHAVVESYTVLCDRNGPTDAVVAGRLFADGRRFLATAGRDEATVAQLVTEDGLKRQILVVAGQPANRFAFA